MHRRTFLRLGPAAAALAAVAPIVPSRGASVSGRGAARFPGPGSHLVEATLDQLGDWQRTGRETAVSLSKAYLARIEALDRRGPSLNAVIELNPDALAIAASLDRERKAHGPRGPLHGVPVLVKDNLDTHDRMSTTAGSLALAGSIAPRDAFVVERLRGAGAVILGKTNLSEWANFRSSRSTSGWSGRGGLTRHPYVLDRNPSGSSSGSAVAVAASLCAVAIGTETDGSILSPSSFNGIVGLKPTVGLVSRAGIIPIAHSQDTAGPMTRTVREAALVLEAIAGADPRDAATQAMTGKVPADYAGGLRADGLRGARLGVVRQAFGPHPEADAVSEQALESMRRAGAVLVDPATIPSYGSFGGSEFEVLLYEFKADLNAYFQSLGPGAPVRSLEELIAFNERFRERELAHFGQDILLKAQAKGPLTDGAYRDALAKNHRLTRAEGIDAVMDRERLDALVAPTTGPAHVTDLVYGDRDTGGSTSLAAVAGYPSITVPAGFVRGLPVGVSFFGRAFSEALLLRLAHGFEQATRVRRPPEFRSP